MWIPSSEPFPIFYDIRLADMQSRKRPARIAFPRQVAMYLTRELTNMSLVEIGNPSGVVTTEPSSMPVKK